MSAIGDEIRAEAAIADRPGQMARLEEIASRVDRIVAAAVKPGTIRALSASADVSGRDGGHIRQPERENQ